MASRSTLARTSSCARSRIIAGRADGRAYAQAAVIVLGRRGIFQALLDVLDRDEAHQVIAIVDHQQLLDAMLVQNRLGVGQRGAHRNRDQVFLSHHFADGNVGAGFKAQIAIGQDADQLFVLGDRNARDAIAPHHLQRVGDLLLRRHGDGIDDHAAFRALHLVDFGGLLLDGQIAVDDPQAALLGHGDGHARLGHGVHGRADQGHAKFNVAGQMGGGVGQRGYNIRLARQQQHVIKGQRLGHRKMDHDSGSMEGINVYCRVAGWLGKPGVPRLPASRRRQSRARKIADQCSDSTHL